MPMSQFYLELGKLQLDDSKSLPRRVANFGLHCPNLNSSRCSHRSTWMQFSFRRKQSVEFSALSSMNTGESSVKKLPAPRLTTPDAGGGRPGPEGSNLRPPWPVPATAGTLWATAHGGRLPKWWPEGPAGLWRVLASGVAALLPPGGCNVV